METTSATQQEVILTLAKYLVTQCSAQITDFQSLELEDVSVLYTDFIRQKSVSYLPIEFASMFSFLKEHAAILAPVSMTLLSKQSLPDVQATYFFSITNGDVEHVITLEEDFFTLLLTEEDFAVQHIQELFTTIVNTANTEDLLEEELELTENKLFDFNPFNNNDFATTIDIFSEMQDQDIADDEHSFEYEEVPSIDEELAKLSSLVTALFKSVSNENRAIVKNIRAELLELEVAVEEQEGWTQQALAIMHQVLALEVDEANELKAQLAVIRQLALIIPKF